EVVLPADGVDRAAPAPGLRPPRPVVTAERLLRRVHHAGRGHQGTKRSAAEHGAVQLLRPNRAVRGGTDLAAGGPGPETGLGRPTGYQRRDDPRRRRRATGTPGCRGRD